MTRPGNRLRLPPLSNFRKKLIACRGQMIDIADRCLASDNQELSDLQEVRERLENML